MNLPWGAGRLTRHHVVERDLHGPLGREDRGKAGRDRVDQIPVEGKPDGDVRRGDRGGARAGGRVGRPFEGDGARGEAGPEGDQDDLVARP